MNVAEIEGNLKDMVEREFAPGEFPFDLLTSYGAPRATIAKLRQGITNVAARPGDVLLKKKLYFRSAASGRVAVTMDELKGDPLIKKHAPRFLVVTDGKDVVARDIQSDQALDIEYRSLNDSFDFFLPLAGYERYEVAPENPADIKATGRIAKLYDEILKSNPTWGTKAYAHNLNVFITRLLFSMFAEDTGIFPAGLFTSTVMSMSREDGSDVSGLIATIFRVMNMPEDKRSGYPEFARRFPYVNGGLFADGVDTPAFSARARRLLKDCGDLDWKLINPDIFGSMLQGIATDRASLGMHYTSVPNILKVLQPQFLISLENDLQNAWASEARLRRLLLRISKIRVFDPACGSGNFLVIAYRELRKIELRVIERLREVSRQAELPLSGIKLTQFYGIEISDFAAETAKLSLWIAEYIANARHKDVFGDAPPALPLRDSGNITRGNATREDWVKACPPPMRTGPRQEREVDDEVETYIVGNPPYLGRAQQTDEQKADIKAVFAPHTTKYKKLDYVACWLLKAAEYGESVRSTFSLVTTNSICQGEQVALLWPLLFDRGLEIGHAYTSFKWSNNASKNAGVTVIIVGVRPRSTEPKVLYSETLARNVSHISPYLTEGGDLIVRAVSNARAARTPMNFGSMPNDDGNLILSEEESADLKASYPASAPFIRRLVGANELIKGLVRYCIWIPDEQLKAAKAVPPIAARIAANGVYRNKSKRKETKALADVPHRFGEVRHQERAALVVPSVSSENRPYIPVGILPAGVVVNNLAFTVYDAPEHLLAILSSRMHFVWTQSVGGQLETRLRYSNTLVYNTFPFPDLTEKQKHDLEAAADEIIRAREEHPGKSLAWLYDQTTMPSNLQKAQKALDDLLERIYVGRPFKSDAERLEHLFKLYEKRQSGDKNATRRKVDA